MAWHETELGKRIARKLRDYTIIAVVGTLLLVAGSAIVRGGRWVPSASQVWPDQENTLVVPFGGRQWVLDQSAPPRRQADPEMVWLGTYNGIKYYGWRQIAVGGGGGERGPTGLESGQAWPADVSIYIKVGEGLYRRLVPREKPTTGRSYPERTPPLLQ